MSLKDGESSFGKEYLKLLGDEIKVKGQNVYLRGSYAALADAIQHTKLGTPVECPALVVVGSAGHATARTLYQQLYVNREEP